MKDEWQQYEQLRKETELPYSAEEKCFYASKFADVESLLKSEKLTVEFKFRASRQVFGKTILDSDDAEQLQIKRILMPFFTRSTIAHYKEAFIRPLIRNIIRESLEATGGVVDYNWYIAQRIPTQVIMQIFGIPLEHERYLFSHLEKLVLYIDSPTNSLQEAIDAKEELLRFLADCYAQKIPTTPHGILGSLKIEDFEDESELLRTCLMLLTAGMATTIGSLNILLFYIYDHFSTLIANQDDPDFIKKFSQEVIRVQPPLHATIRFVKEDFEFSDTKLRKNDMLKIILASANRDENMFTTPASLELETKKTSSCTFGKGKHACIGADLAIAELVVFIEEFLPLVPQLEVESSADELPQEGNVIKMFQKIQLKKITENAEA